MQLTIKNQTQNPLSYVQGEITVAASGATLVPREYNVLLLSDAVFISDSTIGNVVLNNGSTDLSGPSILILAETLAQFGATPIATLPLYYSAPVNIRQSAATAAGTTVWSMTNNASSVKIVIVERIFLMMGVDTTPLLSSSLQRYELIRFNTATPTGGTQTSVVKMDSLSPSTLVTDVRFADTGLTVTNVVFETPFAVISCPASDGATANYTRSHIPIKLAPGEGLAIRLNVAAVVGQDLSGEIAWSER